MVSLQKGGNVNLTKESPSLKSIHVGLGWKPRATTGAAFDLDSQVFIVDGEDKVLSDQHFVFFNNLSSPETAVRHQGDNETGEGEGDDEVVFVDLAKVPANAQKLVFTVSIYNAEALNQNFGQVANAYIRILDKDTEVEMARYDLSEDASTDRAMIFGELYRNGSDWRFRAVGQGRESLKALAQLYKVTI